MTFQEFFHSMATEVAKLVTQAIREGPPREFVVNRVEPTGQQRQESTSLAQIMAEQNDLLKVQVLQQKAVIRSNQELTAQMKKTAAACRAIAKAQEDAL